MSKQKGPDKDRAKDQGATVAENSLQPRAPGWVAPGGANVQSANIEQQGAALRARGALHVVAGTGQQASGTARQGEAEAVPVKKGMGGGRQ